MNKPGLPDFIHQMLSSKQIWLALQVEVEEENDASSSNFAQLCHILATCNLKALDLQLICFCDNINTFVPQLLFYLLHVKKIKGLLFEQNFRNPHRNNRQIQENRFPMDLDLLPLFSPHKKLDNFTFLAEENAMLIKFFPFEELQELQSLRIGPGCSTQLNDNDFETCIARLKSCKKLGELYFNLKHCSLLTDVSVRNLCTELLKYLPDLETLNLTFGYAPHPSCLLPQQFTPPKCLYTPHAVNYLAESLPILASIKRLSLGLQIKDLSDKELNTLFDALSHLKTLQVLEISVLPVSGSLSDSTSSSIKDCLKNLMCLQDFCLALRNCDKLTNLFLEDISSAFTIRKASKSLRRICMNFQNSGISTESMDECASFIKTQLPSCYVSIFRR